MQHATPVWKCIYLWTAIFYSEDKPNWTLLLVGGAGSNIASRDLRQDGPRRPGLEEKEPDFKCQKHREVLERIYFNSSFIDSEY